MNSVFYGIWRWKYYSLPSIKKARQWKIFYSVQRNRNNKYVTYVRDDKHSFLIREHIKKGKAIKRCINLRNKRKKYLEKVQMTKIEKALFYGE